MYGTLILETNKKPLLAEAPTEADARRIIDMPFRATFTSNSAYWDDSQYIYKADLNLKNDDFRISHRCAIIKILADTYKQFKARQFAYIIPDSIRQRTDDYMDASCDIIVWFQEVYTRSSDPNAYVKVSDVHATFRMSKFFEDCTKAERRKHNYKHFCDYMSRSLFMKKYYKENVHGARILLGWEYNRNPLD